MRDKKPRLSLWRQMASGSFVVLFQFSLIFSLQRFMVLGMIPIPEYAAFYVLLAMVGVAMMGAILVAIIEGRALLRWKDRIGALFSMKKNQVLLPTWQDRHFISLLTQKHTSNPLDHFVRVIFRWALYPILTMSVMTGIVMLFRNVLGLPPLSTSGLMLTVLLSLLVGFLASILMSWAQKDRNRFQTQVLISVRKAYEAYRKKYAHAPIYAIKKRNKKKSVQRAFEYMARFILPIGSYALMQTILPMSDVFSMPHWASITVALLMLLCVELVAHHQGKKLFALIKSLGLTIGTIAASYIAIRLMISTFANVSILMLSQDIGAMIVLGFFSGLCGVVALTMHIIEQKAFVGRTGIAVESQWVPVPRASFQSLAQKTEPSIAEHDQDENESRNVKVMA